MPRRYNRLSLNCIHLDILLNIKIESQKIGINFWGKRTEPFLLPFTSQYELKREELFAKFFLAVRPFWMSLLHPNRWKNAIVYARNCKLKCRVKKHPTYVSHDWRTLLLGPKTFSRDCPISWTVWIKNTIWAETFKQINGPVDAGADRKKDDSLSWSCVVSVMIDEHFFDQNKNATWNRFNP